MQHVSFKELAERSSLSPEEQDQFNEELEARRIVPKRSTKTSDSKTIQYIQQQNARIAQLESEHKVEIERLKSVISHLTNQSSEHDAKIKEHSPTVNKAKRYHDRMKMAAAKFNERAIVSGGYSDTIPRPRYSRILEQESGGVVPSHLTGEIMSDLGHQSDKTMGYWVYRYVKFVPEIDEKYDDKGELLPEPESDDEDLDFSLAQSPSFTPASSPAVSPPPNYIQVNQLPMATLGQTSSMKF